MAMNKDNTMTTREANHLTKLKEAYDEHRERYYEYVQKMLEKYGESKHYFENDDKVAPYLRVSITDNIKEIMEKGVVWTGASVKPGSVKIEALKRKPKEME